jgi:hypothetical protein
MKQEKKLLQAAALVAVVFAGLLSCENPLKSNLGEKVDVVPPEIRIVSPLSGAYVKDVESFTGVATDDLKVVKVEVGIYANGAETITSWSDTGIKLNFKSDMEVDWTYTVDTRTISEGGDGTIKIRFRVTDNSKKTKETEDLAYIIKNSPPELKLTIPDMKHPPYPGTQSLITGDAIRGMATDRRGIAIGYPKIQFWLKSDYPNADPPADHPKYGWQTVDIPVFEGSDPRVMTAMEFRYALQEWTIENGKHKITGGALPVAGYRFRLWVKDSSPEEAEVFYPPLGDDPIDVELTSPVERPVIDLAVDTSGGVELDENGYVTSPAAPHLYVDRSPAYKAAKATGDVFIFRVLARHSEGISRAELAWRQDGSSDSTLHTLYWDGDNDHTDPFWEGIGVPHDDDPLKKDKIFIYTAPANLFSSSAQAYQFYVTAYSEGGNTPNIPQPFTIYLDSGAPFAQINGIRGASAVPTDPGSDGAYIVNGTIEVGYTVYDDETNLRDESPGQKAERYLLLNETDGAVLNASISGGDDLTEYFDDAISIPSSFLVNTSGLTDGGTYWLFVFTQDNAYNIGAGSVKLTVKQDADYPVVQFPASGIDENLDDIDDLYIEVNGNGAVVQPANVSRKNIFGNNQGIEVKLSDDDGLDLSTITITMTDAATIDLAHPNGVAHTLTLTPEQAAGIFSPGQGAVVAASGSIPQSILAQALGQENVLRDGVYRFEIEVKDRKTDKPGELNPVSSKDAVTSGFWFAVYSAAPVITVAEPEPGSLQSSVPFDMRGSVTSNLKIQRLWLTSPTGYSNGAITTTTEELSLGLEGYSSGSYTYTWEKTGINADVDTHAEDKTFTLAAVDMFNNRQQEPFTVTVDKTPPEVELLRFEPGLGSDVDGKGNNFANGVIKVFMSASDTKGLEEVRWFLLPSSAPPPIYTTPVPPPNGLGGILVSGTPVEINTVSLPGGAYTLYLIAKDRAGNISQVPSGNTDLLKYGKLQTLTVKQETDRPRVTEAGIASPYVGYAPLSGLRITGRVYDDDGFTETNKNHLVQIRFPSSQSNDVPTWPVDDEAGWIDAAGVLSGSSEMTFSLDVAAYLNNHSSDPLNDYLKGDGGSKDGKKFFQVRVKEDKAAPMAMVSGTAERNFILDNVAPQLAFDTSRDQPFKTAADLAAAFTGTITEKNFDSLEYSFNGDGYRALDSSFLSPASGDKTKWTFPVSAFRDAAHDGTSAVDFDSIADGPVSINLRAWDKSGSDSGAIQWTFYKDTNGTNFALTSIEEIHLPDNWYTDSATWTAAAKAQWITDHVFTPSVISGTDGAGNLTISGNFSDEYSNMLAAENNGSNPIHFYYRFDESGTVDNNWQTGNIPGTDQAQQTANWTINLPIAANLADGWHEFDLKVSDKTGNYSYWYDLVFRVDREAPEVDDIVSDPAAPDTSGHGHVFGALGSDPGDTVFTLRGTVTDANLNKVWFSLDRGEIYQVVDTTPLTIGSGGTWSRAITKEELEKAGTGTNSDAIARIARITAVDYAGRETEKSFEFYRDSIAPVITPVNLETGETTLDAGVNIHGTVEDANRVKSLRYYLEKFDYDQAKWPSDSGFTGSPATVPHRDDVDFTARTTDLPKTDSGNTLANWTLKLGSDGINLAEGKYRLHIYAADYSYNANPADAGNPVSMSRIFYVDSNQPDIPSLTVSPYYNGGTLVFNGTASDSNRITSVKGWLQAGANTWGPVYAVLTTTANPDEVSWTVTIPGLTGVSASPTLYIEAGDSAGRTFRQNSNFTLDNTAPEVSIEEPGLDYARAVGEVAVIGEMDDETGIMKLEYHIGNSEIALDDTNIGWHSAGDLVINGTTMAVFTDGFSWSITLPSSRDFTDPAVAGNIADYVSPITGGNPNLTDHPDFPSWDLGANPLYELPITIRATDYAGNTHKETRKLWLYPRGDDVLVTIKNPSPSIPDDNRIMGGEISVYGSAQDNDLVYAVSYRIIDLDEPGEPQILKKDASGNEVTPDDADANGYFTGGTYTAAHRGWYKANLDDSRGMEANWSFIINSFQELDPQAPALRKNIRIEVIAWDANSDRSGIRSPGSITSVTAIFENGAPRFGEPRIMPGTGTWDEVKAKPMGEVYGSKEFTLKMIVKDEGGISSIQWLTSGSTEELLNTSAAYSGITVSAAALGTGYFPDAEGYYNYEITAVVDTALLESGGYAGAAEYFDLSFRAFDASSKSAQSSRLVSVPIDNYYPRGLYNGNSYKVAGTDYYFQGTARDDGEYTSGKNADVQGVEKVILWLTKSADGTDPIALNGGIFTPGETISAEEGRISDTQTLSFLLVTLPGDKASGITISADYAQGDPNDGGRIKRFIKEGTSRQWSAQWNSTGVSSGVYYLNYVVFDKAGNAAVYRQRIIVKNNDVPLITAITLGTDLYDRGTITGTYGPVSINYNNINVTSVDVGSGIPFTVRNNRLQLDVATTGGAYADRRYQVYYAAAGADVNASALTDGSIYTIKTGGDTNWTAVGAPGSWETGTAFIATGSTGIGNGTAAGYGLSIGQTDTPGVASKSFTYAGTVSGTAAPSTAFGSGGIADGEALFFIQVWDGASTEAETYLADFAFIKVKVANNDPTKPSQPVLYDFNPKTEGVDTTMTVEEAVKPLGFSSERDGNNDNRGGLYNTGTISAVQRSGHIEPRSATPAKYLGGGTPLDGQTYDLVSGKVILRGYVEDDLRIKTVQLKFDSETITILQEITNGDDKGRLGPAVPEAYVFDEISLQKHRAEWAYIWDTETIPNGAIVGDVNVQVIVTNYGTANNNETVDRTMNLRPFITGFTRTNSNAPRSRQGWYGFYREEADVIVKGFNLYKTSATVTLRTSTGTVNAAGTSVEGGVSFTVPNTASSGQISYVTGGAAAVNNLIPADEAVYNHWNREDWDEGAELWTGSRNAHIWQSNAAATGSNRGYFVGSNRARNPSMTINPNTGALYGAWIVESSGNSTNNDYGATYYGYNTDGTTNPVNIFQWLDAQEETDIHYSTKSSAGPMVVYNNTGQYGTDTGWNDLGGIFVYDGVGSNRSEINLTGDGGTSTGYWVESASYNDLAAQFKNPRIVTNGASTHVSYYDTKDGSLKYRWINANASTNDGGSSNSNDSNDRYRWINLDGGSDTHDTYANTARVRPTSTGSRSAAAGEWNAIDLSTDKKPVIVYYDNTNKTLKLAYSTVVIDTLAKSIAGGNWKVQSVFPSDDPNKDLAGEYVSLRINPANNVIHIACFSQAKNALLYITGTWTSTTGNYTFSPSVVVDDQAAGRWADVSLDAAGNPWITYLDNSRASVSGGYDGAKVAYRDSTKFPRSWEDQNGTAAGGWETLNVPARYRVKNARVSIENCPTGVTQFWSAAVGYLSSTDLFCLTYYVK